MTEKQRLEKVLYNLRIHETEIIRGLMKKNMSIINKRHVEKYGKQFLTISETALSLLLSQGIQMLETNRQIINLNKMIRDSGLSIKETPESNKALVNEWLEIKESVETLMDLKNQQYVLENSINTCNATKPSEYLEILYNTSDSLKRAFDK